MPEALNHLNPSFQNHAIQQTQPVPSLQYLVDPKTFFAAELLVKQICIVNDFSNHAGFRIANAKRLLERLERAVLSTVSKSALKHIEGYCLARNTIFESESEASFLINKTPNQPGGR